MTHVHFILADVLDYIFAERNDFGFFAEGQRNRCSADGSGLFACVVCL